VEIIRLFDIGKAALGTVLASAQRFNADGPIPMTEFDGFPTAMLLRPATDFTGSLHYMFFPRRATQAFHYHPSSRYLLLLGDVDLSIHHSTAGPASDPRASEQVEVVQAGTLATLRFPAQYWHSFRTESTRGRGVLAFTFHEDDGIASGETSRDDLMQQETTFWHPE
jgi:hypothetical protein